ncbi:MAG TPA: methyltransferase domain-containing protein [Deltaproteobacteria bacterium]|jgi:ubiquinone/menaquinone biosynthesis C-methylase UbiE|nr:methyltransferase domain-containing protein [Deltaproteobacteria bacterium]
MGKGDLFSRIEVCCPVCQGRLLEAGSEDSVVCSSCRAAYPRERRLIDLIPGRRTAGSFPQLAMESSPIISVYEGYLWRKNPLFAFFMGITFEREFEITCRALSLHDNDTVLDLACGTGIYGRRITAHLPEGMVVGIDLSLPMLSYAAARFDEGDLSNYLLIHGDASRIPLADESIDAAMCGASLHLFPDPEAAVMEISRVLKDGGRFAVSVFSPGQGRLFEWIASMVRTVEGIRGISSRDLEGMFSRAGFGDIVCHHAEALWLIMSAVKK